MLVGVIMAVLLTAVLYHMVGVGDAIVYRERMQEAADATAFESAVWHARTMNLLVALNIIMSAILSIMVAWRTLEFVLGVAAVVIGLISLLPFMEWLEPAAAWCGDTLAQMLPKDPKIFEKVDNWLGKLNRAEKIVSSFAPPLDVLEPAMTNTDYYGQSGASVGFTVPLSFSIMPSLESFGQVKLKFPARMNMGTALPAMPIQEDGYWKVCSKAGEFLAETSEMGPFMIAAGAGPLQNLTKHFKSAYGKITGTFPGFFCGGLKAPDGAEQEIASRAKDKCDADKEKYDKEQGRAKPNDVPRHNKGPFKYDDCMEKAQQGVAAKKARFNTVPAKVWDIARNGGVFFQTWAFAHGAPEWSYDDDAGVQIAAAGGPDARGEDEMSFHLGAAQAEYFYDCEKGLEWAECAEEAMWNMKWKARLRRLRSPTEQVDIAGIAQGWGAGAAVKGLEGALDKVLGKWADKSVHQYVPKHAKGPKHAAPGTPLPYAMQWLTGHLTDNYWFHYYGEVKLGGGQGDKLTYDQLKMNDWIARTGERSTIIH